MRSDPRILSPFRLKGVMRTLLQLQKENCLLWTEVNGQVFTSYFFFFLGRTDCSFTFTLSTELLV